MRQVNSFRYDNQLGLIDFTYGVSKRSNVKRWDSPDMISDVKAT